LSPWTVTPIMILRRLDEPGFLERTCLHEYVVCDDTEDSRDRAGGGPAPRLGHGACRRRLGAARIDARLRLDWEVSQTRGGRPEIQGYVINDYIRAAINVRLLVETLDGNGQAIGRAYGFVVDGVPALSRAPFVVPLKTAGAS
jgi:hypothetical protein